MRTNNKLGVFDVTMVVVSLVIGLGIFRTSKDAAIAAGTPTVFFAAWVVGGIIAFCGALTFAEIGSRYPVTGGYYKIFSYAYHPAIAFSVNGITLISNASSTAGVALIGSEYIVPVLFKQPVAEWVHITIAIGAIMVFYAVNLAGLRVSARLQNVLMGIKIAMLVVIISGLFFPSLYHQSDVVVTATASNKDNWAVLLAFGVALKATSFTYGGYQQTINFGEEIVSPRHTIPKSIFYGIAVILILYMGVNWSYYKLIGFENLKQSTGIATILAGKLFGEAGRYIASILLFIAVLAYVNIVLLSSPRMMYAMSHDGILPKAFGKRNKRDVLIVSLTAFASICMLIVFTAGSFDRILSFSLFCDSVSMALAGATLFIIRKKMQTSSADKVYSMKAYPWIPIVFIAGYCFVGVIICISNPMYALIGTAVFAGLLLIYLAMLRK
jgi:APA family basic amino acid/polyamine antiporter